MNDDVAEYIRQLEARIAWLKLQLRQSRHLGVDRDAEEAKRQDRLRGRHSLPRHVCSSAAG